MKKYNIKLFHTENEEKSSIIGRYNRTQNNEMKIVCEINKNFKWIDSLDKIVKDYNNSIRRTIGMKPIEVNKNNEQYLFDCVYNYDIHVKLITKFKIGNRIRIRVQLLRNLVKINIPNNWSREIFIVNQINNTNPITYKLKDLNEVIIGSFHKYELKKPAL